MYNFFVLCGPKEDPANVIGIIDDPKTFAQYQDWKVKAFIEIIRSEELHKKLDKLGEYGYSKVGENIQI